MLSGKRYLYNKAQQTSLGGYGVGDIVSIGGILLLSLTANNLTYPDPASPVWSLYA